MKYEIIAFGGPGGNFLYVKDENNYITSYQTTNSANGIREEFFKLPYVVNMDEAKLLFPFKKSF